MKPRTCGLVRFLIIALSITALIGCAALRTPAGGPGPVRLLIVSIDGLGGDLLLKARVPEIRRLMKRGAYTLQARTIDPPYTVPAHVSMLTGVLPETHGVTWNDHIEQAYPEVPT